MSLIFLPNGRQCLGEDVDCNIHSITISDYVAFSQGRILENDKHPISFLLFSQAIHIRQALMLCLCALIICQPPSNLESFALNSIPLWRVEI